MENPAARNLMDMVRQVSEMARKARSGEPTLDDYLKAVASEPRTEWFMEILHEKSAELEKETERADRMTRLLRNWYAAKLSAGDAADQQLISAIRSIGVISE
jgi:hypothetical protein